jgi:hypothetical protein
LLTLAHVKIDRGGAEAFLGSGVSDWEDYLSNLKRMLSRVENDMPMHVRTCLQEGSFSKIHGLRELSSSISRSTGLLSAMVQSARLDVLRRKSVAPSILESTAAMLERDLVDTRDWDLIPAVGPSVVSVRDIAITGETDAMGLKVLARTWLAVDKLDGPDKVEVFSVEDYGTVSYPVSC